MTLKAEFQVKQYDIKFRVSSKVKMTLKAEFQVKQYDIKGRNSSIGKACIDL